MGAATGRLRRVPFPHALGFRAAIAALVAIAAGALAVAVALYSNGSRRSVASGSAWSSWAPNSSGNLGISEIASHLASTYRLSPTQQLDVITPIAVSQTTAAGTTTGSGLTIAVNTAAAGKAPSLALLNGQTVAYNICGTGPRDCELAGTPSVSRMLLLRREAFELALYTFEYIRSSQNVIVVLPPGRTTSASGTLGAPVTVAVAFVRSELEPWLRVPLSRTLGQTPPDAAQLAAWSQSPEATFVDEVTAHALFSSQLESQQIGGTLLVLTQLPAQ